MRSVNYQLNHLRQTDTQREWVSACYYFRDSLELSNA